MNSGITTQLAIGTLIGIVISFSFPKYQLYSGLIAVAIGIIFSLPVICKIVFGVGFFVKGTSWAGPLLMLCFYIIYLNYILYIIELEKKGKRGDS